MYLKRLLALLCSLALVFCLLPSTAFAEGGNGNIDGGGGSMGKAHPLISGILEMMVCGSPLWMPIAVQQYLPP